MRKVLIATSNAGKLRDFAAAARVYGVEVAGLPEFSSLPAMVEDQLTFELNARKKAEHYSHFAPGELVLADDSGLEVDALGGAPGVHSARYAAMVATESGIATTNSGDAENNARLLRELASVPEARRTARFVCAIVPARDGQCLGTFVGSQRGVILRAPRGEAGFGYDPLFFLPDRGKTFAELSPEAKAEVSHRGHAFRAFLQWMMDQG